MAIRRIGPSILAGREWTGEISLQLLINRESSHYPVVLSVVSGPANILIDLSVTSAQQLVDQINVGLACLSAGDEQYSLPLEPEKCPSSTGEAETAIGENYGGTT